MTHNTEFIVELETVHAGDPWHGANTMHILSRVPFSLVNTRHDGYNHTIAELLRHMIVWKTFVIRMLDGETDYRIELNTDQDWPPTNIVTQDEWASLIKEFDDVHHELVDSVRTFSHAKLDEHVGFRLFTYRFLLHGITHHEIYHGGQIALLTKVLG